MDDTERKEYFELLEFPSIGADPLHLRDCTACAMWLRKWLEQLDFTVELVASDRRDANGALAGDPPIVFAERPGDEGASTVLLYGHYDVQPPDPLEQWNTPPFTPTEKDGRVYARGSQDDKGQFFAFLCGLREFLSTNQKLETRNPIPTIKLLLDSQEESGSPALFSLLPKLGRKLAANVLLVCDTSAAADLQPAIIAGLRGVNHFTVRLHAANRDLHSGEYGGVAPNAAQGLAELVASLHHADGSIAVAGFTDGIEPPTAEELAAAEASAVSVETMIKDIGCDPAGGERAKPMVVRNCFEPTIEVNGIHSGYGGPGSKTIIPCEAIAKISTRLVPGQDPKRSFDAIVKHLESNCPPGMRVTVDEFTGGAGGFRLPLSSPLFRLATEVLKEIDPRGAVFVWDGASIPVISEIRAVSGAAPLLVGWGQPDDRIHSPNESYSIVQFDKAKAWAQAILAAL